MSLNRCKILFLFISTTISCFAFSSLMAQNITITFGYNNSLTNTNTKTTQQKLQDDSLSLKVGEVDKQETIKNTKEAELSKSINSDEVILSDNKAGFEIDRYYLVSKIIDWQVLCAYFTFRVCINYLIL